MKNLLICFSFILFSCLWMSSCISSKAMPGAEFTFSGARTEMSNLVNLDTLWEGQDAAAEEYYFVVVGDTRNFVRSMDLANFNQVAKEIIYARDQESGKRIYEKIKFVVHCGDFVYEGAAAEQWDNLKKAFSHKDYARNNYPYIKMLFRDKPLFPALGNHEIMDFKFKSQTKYMDLAASPAGVEYFKDFFNWDEWIRSAGILVPVPADLPEERFRQIAATIVDPARKQQFLDSYVPGRAGRRHRQMTPGVSPQSLAATLADIFNGAGYHTLPVLSSDNMITYAFEYRGMVFLVLDSMARGWHYPGFTRLKKALFPDKRRQHELHLFSPSEWNGQYMFFKALQERTRRQGKKMILFMHHSPINSVNDLDAGGMEYNLKLILGLGDVAKNEGPSGGPGPVNRTFFDDILFDCHDSHGAAFLDTAITSCTHLYQQFRLQSKVPAHEGGIDWFVTGGGGAEPERHFDDSRLKVIEDRLNERFQRQASENGSEAAAAVHIRDNRVVNQFHYLLVKMKGSRILHIAPCFISSRDVVLRKPTMRLEAKFQASFYREPFSFGQEMKIGIGSWGMEWLHPFLSFITWDPSFGIGFLYYNSGDQAVGAELYAATFAFSPLSFKLRFPQGKELTVHLPGIEFLNGIGDYARSYLSFGLEAPLFFNLFGKWKPWGLGLKYRVPMRFSSGHDPDFGDRLRWSFYCNYAFSF